MKKNRKSLLLSIQVILGLLIILAILGYGMKRYSDYLINEGDLQVGMSNYTAALQKYQQAKMVWPISNKSLDSRIRIVKDRKDAPQIIIFFKDSIKNEEITSLTEEIKQIKGVTETKFVSGQDDYDAYVERNKNNPELLKLVTPSILPNSLKVFLATNDLMDQIAKLAQSKDYVDTVVVNKVDPKTLKFLDD